NSDCGIYPGKTYLIDFRGEVSNRVHAELFLIYYKQRTKVSIESFEINRPSSVIINSDIEEIRVALRISGKGTSFINSIIFTEVNNNIKPRPINDINPNKNEALWETFLTSSEILNGPWYWQKNNYINNLIYSKEVLNVSALFPKNESQYVSYGEQNIEFSHRPLIFNKEIDPTYRYEISFKGQKSHKSIVYLFLIFYSDDEKKEQIETFSLNENRSIRILENVKFFRIALKISGEGSIQIDEIKIRRKRLNNHLSYLSTSEKSNLLLPSSLKKLKIAVICDTFTMNCLQPECELITFSPDDWKEVLTLNFPHILFVESAWEGNQGKWTKKVASNSKASIIDLLELINWCKQNKIPTIFWNKEDPVHFNSFITTAQHFDYIFTTDQASIENYKKRVKHDNVYSLPFAAQPQIHNPIETYDRKQGICFAGSYYANRYIKRQGDMRILFEAAAEHGLTIYDRNYGKQLPEFYFPQSLRKYIKGNLPPDRIDIAYKGYKIALNVNSVVHSPTMFSRRVFECLACNTPVVSTYSKGIENIFKDIVFMGNTKEDFDKEFNKLLKNDFYYNKRTHLGLRNVLEKHTYEKRLRYVLEKVKISIEEEHPRIQVYSIVENLKELNYILNMYMSQNYEFKHLIVILLQSFDYSSI
ncbi:glycosyltransferase, partial [Priestia megaterium]